MIRTILAMVLVGLAVFFMFRIWQVSRDVEKRPRTSEESPQYLNPRDDVQNPSEGKR